MVLFLPKVPQERGDLFFMVGTGPYIFVASGFVSCVWVGGCLGEVILGGFFLIERDSRLSGGEGNLFFWIWKANAF